MKHLLLLVSLLPAAASAQIRVPRYVTTLVNRVGDPGFESFFLTPWNATGGYALDSAGQKHPNGFGALRTGGARSGKRSFDFGIPDSLTNSTVSSPVRQTLATPVSGGKVILAAVSARSLGQYLHIEIRYSDKTSSSLSEYVYSAASPERGGWQEIDFRKAIKPNKTIVAVEFRVDAGVGYVDNMRIDNVAISEFVRLKVR